MAAMQTLLRRTLGFRNSPQLLSTQLSSPLRTFTTTRSAQRDTRPVPKFPPTSNEKLDELLRDLRENYFIPPHLPQEYYRLVTRPQNHARLLSDPVNIVLDGEPYTLTPKPNNLGAPVSKFKQALGLMSEKSDYAIIPELIRGYYQANGALSSTFLHRMVRHLIRVGRVDILMDIARSADEIDFRFQRRLARDFMMALRERHMKSEIAGIMKGLRDGAVLLDIVGKRELTLEPESATRYCDDPIVLGGLLWMRSDAALQFKNEEWLKDVTSEVALKLKAAWGQVDFEPRMVEYEDRQSMTQVKNSYYNTLQLIKGYNVVLEALLQAKSVLAGSELSPWLEAESERLAVLVTNMGAYLKRHKPMVFPKPEGKKEGAEKEKEGEEAL
ncbi:uncharacterized protein H6S33_000685 [Morchella sextelata]|uniref:uncharacterized protein n=1 Tax=Morchella sextelata TaxID=1174677 RepID=UPI001D0390F1|nr:uncharacterized protein H6S33_000685 [Morchella sextelata]KAH0615049.1 hypothetical protein H6S33_000685 [Morchella sextelata]